MDDESIDEDAYKALDQEYDVLAEEEHTLHNIPLVLPDEIKPLVGAFLKLTPRGEMVLDTEYYSEEPVRVGGSGDDGEDDHGDDASGEGSAGSGSSPTPTEPPPAATEIETDHDRTTDTHSYTVIRTLIEKK